jgi:hypothetical protein
MTGLLHVLLSVAGLVLFVVLAGLVGGGLYVLLVHHSITRAEQNAYQRGVAEGHLAARQAAAAGGEYSRGVAAGRRLTEIEHGWGPAVSAPDVPADRLERSPDFNWVTREPVQHMPRPVFDY